MTRHRPRARRRPSPPPPLGDLGPDTPAQRAGKVIERVPGDANGAVRVVRIPAWERGWLRKHLSRQQRAAATELHDAAEAAQVRTASILLGVYVDASPRLGTLSLRGMDARARYAAMIRAMPSETRALVEAVIVLGQRLDEDHEHFGARKLRLRRGLSDLAMHLKFCR